MHSSVLQNDKYIEFMNDNGVDVIALGRLDEGISKNDPKAAEFDTKDEEGKPVKRMLSYPSLTKDEMLKLNSSKAGSYNNTGKIPFTCIVDPHDESEMQRFSGGQSAKGLIEAVEVHKATLNTKFGPSVARSVIKKFDGEAKKITDGLEKAGSAKSLADFNKLIKAMGKDAATIKARTDKVLAVLIEAATKDLDEAAAKLESADVPGAKKLLDKLAPVLKGTDLEARAQELVAKVKAAAAPAK